MKKPILAMIPSGYKASTLYTPIPIDGGGDFTFTRNTVATRMNKDGLIEEVAANVPRLDYREVLKTAYYNFFAFTNDLLNNDYWVLAGVTRTEIDDYEGSSAIKLESFSNADPRFQQDANTGLVTSKTFTYSIVAWIDEGQDAAATLIVYGSTGTEQLQQRSITLTTTPTRYEIVKAFTGSAVSTKMTCRFGLNPNTNTYAYVTKPQIEEGNGFTKYQETKTFQGYETSFKIAACPSLLIEPASTNQIDYSQPTAGGQGWATNGTPVVTYLSDIAPDGTKTAQRYETSANSEGKYLSVEQPFTIGEFITASFFVKHISGNPMLKINISGTSVGTVRGFYYNIEEGFVNEIQDSATQASVEDYGNGWFRIIATAEATATGVARSTIYVSGGDPSVWLWWGAQLEVSQVATSYIPTTGSAVTRNADSCSNGNLLNLVDDYRGSMFAEMKSTEEVGVFQPLRLAVGTDSDNGIRFMYSPISRIRIIYRVGGISVLDWQGDYTITEFAKLGITWDSSVIKLYANGVKVDELLSPTLIEGLNTITINSKISVKNIKLYNETLTEAEAIELTTI